MKNNILQKNIPKGWRLERFGNLNSIRTGKKDANAQVDGGQYPFFTCAQGVSQIDNYSFDTEAVIVAGNGDFNVKYYKGRFDAYQRTYVIEPKNELLPMFLYYSTQYTLPRMTLGAHGSTIKYLKIGDFTEFQFLLPSVSEQKKIAEILSSVDEEIQKIDKIISQAEKLKSGLMVELFTKGIGHKKFKKTKMGMIPIGWNILKLKDILTLEYGRPLKDSVRNNGEVPVYGSNGIVGFHNKNLVKAPGIIVGRKGGAGEIMFSEKDFFVIDTAYFIETNVHKKFTFYLLNFLKLKSLVSKGAIPGLNRDDVYAKEITLPEKKEQEHIARILGLIDYKIIKNKELKEKFVQLKKGLMLDLLSGKVRVKV